MALSRAQLLRAQARNQQYIAQESRAHEHKPVNWLAFWLVFGIMLGKDALDLIFSLIGAVSAATVVGTPITVVLFVLGCVVSITVSAIALLYHISTGRSMGARFMVTSFGMLIGFIPILNLLPETTLTFLAAAFAGNMSSKIRFAKLFTGRAG